MNTLPTKSTERSAPDLPFDPIDELRRQHDQRLLLREDRMTRRAHQSALKRAVKARWANAGDATTASGPDRRNQLVRLTQSAQEIGDQDFDQQACDILAMLDHSTRAF